MMKKLIFTIGILTFLISCSDDLEEYNIDPKNPEFVDAAYMFSYGQYNLAKQLADGSYNQNVSRYWANYATQTTYIQESNYDAANRDIGGSLFYNIYSTVLMELKTAKNTLLSIEVVAGEQAEKNNKLALIKILEVYSYQYLVDNFGDIPFTEALDINNVTPIYDTDEFVYEAIADSLNSAINMLTIGEPSFGSSDLLYGGDVSQWKKFAHSLQLKLGTRISGVNASKAEALINAAVLGGVFDNNADNVVFNYTGIQPYINPLYDYFVIDSRNGDFIATENFIQLLTDLNDPRIDVFYDDNIEDGMIGAVYGASGNSYNLFTHFNPDWTDNSTEPSTLMEYSTVCFELAEAVEKGFISGDAEMYYKAGVTASFDALGVESAEDYLTENPYDAENYIESIGIQKYISLFHNAHEAWTESRRSGVPLLADAASSNVANPKRLIYPTEEVLINETNYNDAVSSMGGDTTTSAIFWDIKTVARYMTKTKTQT